MEPARWPLDLIRQTDKRTDEGPTHYLFYIIWSGIQTSKRKFLWHKTLVKNWSTALFTDFSPKLWSFPSQNDHISFISLYLSLIKSLQNIFKYISRGWAALGSGCTAAIHIRSGRRSNTPQPITMVIVQALSEWASLMWTDWLAWHHLRTLYIFTTYSHFYISSRSESVYWPMPPTHFSSWRLRRILGQMHSKSPHLILSIQAVIHDVELLSWLERLQIFSTL